MVKRAEPEGETLKQVAEMNFVHGVAGLSLGDKASGKGSEESCCSSMSRRGVSWWWFGHLVRMPPGYLPGEVFQACPSDPGRTGEIISQVV